MKIKNKKIMPSLKTQKSDIVALLTRGVLGEIPYAGSLLSELIGARIPDQRIERIVKFAEKLETRLSDVEKSLLDSQLSNDEFIGTLEEVISQATRSTSDARREYLASVISNGLTDKEIDHSETKRILTLLGELNDAEIIMLRFYLVETIQGDEEFREKHKKIVGYIPVTLASPQSEKDKEAIKENYREHLISLGLLKNEYRIVHETGLQEIDTFTNAPKIIGRRLTSMGMLFLRQIGLSGQYTSKRNFQSLSG